MSIDDAMRQLARRHADQVPEIAARLARAGISAADTGFDPARVPPLRKSTLRDLQRAAPPWGGMLADGCHPRAGFMSPGGIVEPLVPRMVERLAEMLHASGFGPAHTVLNGFNYHLTPAGLLFHEALADAGCTVLPAGPQNTAAQAEFATTLGANAFVGIASHLKILFEHQPALSIRLAMAGAEPHAQGVRDVLLAEHGVRCVDMYGFAEGGIVAVSCAQAGALHLHADVLAETVEAAGDARLPEGEAGELVVSLDNPGFPLLRFATGDLVRLDPQACRCGRRGVLQLLGRADQSARVKGMLLHQSQLRRFMAAVGAIACQVSVTRAQDRDRIAASVRMADAAATDMIALGQAFQDACRLRVDDLSIDATLAAETCVIQDLRGA